MYNTYKEQQTEAVLLVDASNAFSLVKRKTPLHNIGIICPSIVNCVRNCKNFLPDFSSLAEEIQNILNEQHKAIPLLL